jgi:ABC-type transport system involved in multi-copper enzyme maturation permease subunit
MLGTILRFEVRYHLTRPVTYLYFGIFFLLAFGLVASDVISIVGSGGQLKRNAPWVIAQAMMVLVAVGQVILTGLVGTAVLRDYQYRTHELLFTTPITRFAYLGGRFLGALSVMVIVHLGIPLGLMIGGWMPWVDRTRMAPFELVSYLSPFVVLVLPSVLVLSAIFFAVGALSRSLFAIYTQGMVLLVAWSLATTLTADIDNKTIVALVDPLGLNAFEVFTRYWTVIEKNTLQVPLAGPMLANRLLWSAVAVGLFALTYALFRFRSAPPSLGRRRVAEAPADEPAPAPLAAAPAREFGRRAWWHQLASATRLSFWTIVRQVPFVAIVAIGIINLIMTATYADALYGEKVWPVTYTMVEALDNQFFLFFIILITIYAGEAVWRERQLQADQIVDALPTRSSVFLLGKLGGLILVIAGLLLLLMVTGIVMQAVKGYYHFEPGLYLRYLFGTTFPSLLQITVLAVLVHTLVNHKFVGHVVMILFWASRIFLARLGLEHQLFGYADIPDFTYSDMNGFGPFVPNLTLSAIYWTGVAGLLGAIALLYWVRGTEGRWRWRHRAARIRWAGPVRSVAGAAAAVAVAAGAAIYYNTNVLNHYRSTKETRRLQARYERTYKPLEKIPQPRLVDADVRADLEPERQAFTVSGTLGYVNTQTRPLDTLIVTLSHEELRIDTLSWNRPVTTLVTDSALGTRIYRLVEPLPPKDTIWLRYRARFEQRGFGNGGPTTDVVANGTFINSEYFPVLGYQDGQEIASDDNRRKEKLEPKARMASINDESAREDIYLGFNADWINFKATVSTAPDQIAIAPGYLVREYPENGRRVFEYRMDRPMLAFFSFLSARYQVKRDEWNGVKLEIYYHPGHEYNLDRMMASMKASLDYFGKSFSPYQFRQVRILEFPRYAGFAQAFPNTVPYSESIGFILRAPKKDDDLDMPFYVTAHEVGHQWWAHQVIGANLQGSTLFSEGLANYSALTAMEREYGRDNLQKFLANELDRYLVGRSGEQKKELPLMLVENQPYIHYNKGSLALYALRDLIGEPAMNRALARFVRDKAFQSAPFTTSREFLTYLDAETPDSLRYLIDDLFRTITLWDNKAEEATVSSRADGKYEVAIKVRSLKFRADSLGGQEEIGIADLVDVGVFGTKERGNALGKPLYLEKHWIRAADTTFTVVVDTVPLKAGIDPYNKLIDRDPKDNVREVVRR